MAVADDTARKALLRRGFALEYATLGWNVVGIVILAIAAISARSVALAGFGLDSLIEIGASTDIPPTIELSRFEQTNLTATTGTDDHPILLTPRHLRSGRKAATGAAARAPFTAQMCRASPGDQRERPPSTNAG